MAERPLGDVRPLSRRPRARCARTQRHGSLRQARAARLPVPVELGLGVRGARPRARRSRARPSGGALAASRPVGGRNGAAHRVPRRRRRLFARAGDLGLVGLCRRARCRDERTHAAPGAGHCRSRAARSRCRPRIPRGGASRDRRVAPLARARPQLRRLGPRRDRASVGVGRQCASLRRRARAHRSPRAHVRTQRSQASRRRRAADQRRVRALHGNCRSVARARLPARVVERGSVRVRRPRLQRDPRGRGRGPRVPARRARWRRRTGGRTRGASAHGPIRTLGRDRRRVPAARPARRRRDIGDDRGPVPAVRRRPRRAAGPKAVRGITLVSRALRPVGGESVGRDDGLQVEPRLRSAALLARAGLDQRQLVPRPRPAAVRAGGRGGGTAPLTLRLLETSGFAEYYDPRTGEALGSGDFSWSAALALDLLA